MSQITHATQASTLADILERVLDKGVVIAGDIKVQIADIDLITLKIRLVVASIDKAKEIGINWWEEDKDLSLNTRFNELQDENNLLKERLVKLESARDSV
ncbi:gas vesicle protein [Prosthecochloris sp.]|uniref:gas vesicle protein n=1 Tax=Prosthecochloris sp. TaxID=290513 RepID=UPI00257B1FBB|nr:gas vesicle protein [Prosthecochloris sp.]